jgi:hypothetical protein
VAYNISHVWDGSMYFGARLVLILLLQKIASI